MSSTLTLSFKVGEAAATKSTLKAFAGSYTITITGNTSSKKGNAESATSDGTSRMKLSNDTAAKAIVSPRSALKFTFSINADGELTSVVSHADNVVSGNPDVDYGAAWEVNNTTDLDATTTMYIAINGGTAGDSYNAADVDKAVTGSFSLSIA